MTALMFGITRDEILTGVKRRKVAIEKSVHRHWVEWGMLVRRGRRQASAIAVSVDLRFGGSSRFN